MELSKEKLEGLLREAEVAHAKYEKETGGPASPGGNQNGRDENWPAWYAEYSDLV